uniref:Protein phosphatase 1 regulatory subunit 14B n=1 Tax=Oncorhynchus tshawytscha TaxID=74940 RepID=A0AAZ3QWE2_ONCTS
MATLTSQDSTAQARVYFQTPPGTEDSEVVQKQGRVTVKYDRKELRKRLNLEEWIIEQLTDLYDCEFFLLSPLCCFLYIFCVYVFVYHHHCLSHCLCLSQEEEIPELEIDVDELLDMPTDGDRASRVKGLLVDCYKPTDDFVTALLEKVKGLQKLSTPPKKNEKSSP